MASIIWADEEFDHGFFSGTSCAFGVFDGVHNGHRYLLRCARETARESGGRSIALTFDIDPDEVFHPQRLKKLLLNADRLELLSESGVDDVVVLPFTEGFYRSTPSEFLLKTFDGHVPAHLHVGNDFRFGARAAGTVADLRTWGAANGCEIHAHHLVSADGSPITATRIRLLLASCDIEEANRLLGHPYFITETVHPGRGEGRDMGFRTANLDVRDHDRTLGEGVYAAYATVDGRRYRAAVSVGISPVFADEASSWCEVHILDFDAEVYGQPIKVEFIAYLRPMIRFESTDELIATVLGNIAWVRDNLAL